MIVGITVKNFKAIKSLEQLPLQRFQLLIGPNGSGKSTFLDVIEFVKDCLIHGPAKAVEARTPSFNDLTYMRQGGPIEIELWLDISIIMEHVKDSLFRYSLILREDDESGVAIDHEELYRHTGEWSGFIPVNPFSFKNTSPPVRLLAKTPEGTACYMRESDSTEDTFTFGTDMLTLAHTPADREKYPAANAVRQFLTQGIRYLQLNSRSMRLPCPALRPVELESDGANLARVVGKLLGVNGKGKISKNAKNTFKQWVSHIQYAMEDIESIKWSKRDYDSAEFISIVYKNGLECPSWLASEGALRLLALTIPAFLPPSCRMYMVEEPENGVHPYALEIIMESLSSVPDAQVFVATHSMLAVVYCGIKKLLCFSKSEKGSLIVPGPEHPFLKEWDGVLDLGLIHSSGVLG